jgi:replicative DNA helicase
MRNGFLSERDFPNLTAVASRLATAKLFIDDSPGLSIAELRAKARRLVASHLVQLFVIDYMQLLRFDQPARAGQPSDRDFGNIRGN